MTCIPMTVFKENILDFDCSLFIPVLHVPLTDWNDLDKI